MVTRNWISGFALALCTSCASSQHGVTTGLELVHVEMPAGVRAGQWVPMALLWGTADAEADAARQRAVAAAGVACARLDGRPDADGRRSSASWTMLHIKTCFTYVI